VEATAQAVHAAMADAGIDDAADVHFVQVKCPLLTSAKVQAALARQPVTRDTYESMAIHAAPRRWAWRWRWARWPAAELSDAAC
jgi:hypothetical protein